MVCICKSGPNYRTLPSDYNKYYINHCKVWVSLFSHLPRILGLCLNMVYHYEKSRHGKIKLMLQLHIEIYGTYHAKAPGERFKKCPCFLRVEVFGLNKSKLTLNRGYNNYRN